MSEYEAMSHESSGICWCGPNNHGPERRRTFTVTVEVTVQDPPEDYRNSTLADDINDMVQLAITEETDLDVVVMTVTGTDRPTT